MGAHGRPSHDDLDPTPKSLIYPFKIGTSNQLKYALFHSEDSSTLNTSFIERLNLTIRRGCAYLNRKTPGHARASEPFSKNPTSICNHRI